MATAKHHKKKRDFALALARTQLLSDLMGRLSLDTINSIDFERILGTDWDIIHPAWRNHPARKGLNINFNWLQARNKRRDKLDVSIWCGKQLCGMFLAKLSRKRVTVALRYLESNPYPNPLSGLMIPIGLTLAESFGVSYGVSEILITQPDRNLVEDYRNQGYSLNNADADRERRKCKIRAKVLIKKLNI